MTEQTLRNWIDATKPDELPAQWQANGDEAHAPNLTHSANERNRTDLPRPGI